MKMDTYSIWERRFNGNSFDSFNNNDEGILWLKVKALARKDIMNDFLAASGIILSSGKLGEQARELFDVLSADSRKSLLVLDGYLIKASHAFYASKNIDKTKLESDLYKVQNYEWGGDGNNSLDKFLVKKYVKDISSYDELTSSAADISLNAWKYVEASWYNQWSSYLIESMFNEHPKVIPAIGAIKGVDFFIDDCPLDLKVTYFPKSFLSQKLRALYGCREITYIKSVAKNCGIGYSKEANDEDLFLEIVSKLEEGKFMKELDEIMQNRASIIAQAKSNPEELIKNLYENQGEMRFGAENRLFLILVDINHLELSWRLKRSTTLLSPIIKKYLNGFTKGCLSKIKFQFGGKSYESLADTIFIEK